MGGNVDRLKDALMILNEARLMLWDMYRFAENNEALSSLITEVKNMVVSAMSRIEDYLIEIGEKPPEW